MNRELCSKIELKEFADHLYQFAYSNQRPTAFNFARWIEEKSNDKYTVVDKAFIKELYRLIDYNTDFSSKISHQLNGSWMELIRENEQVRSKWTELIKLLKL